MSTIGERIRVLRWEHGMTLEELARESGMSRYNLGRIEKGHHTPRGQTVFRIAKALGVDLREITRQDNEQDRQVLLNLLEK